MKDLTKEDNNFCKSDKPCNMNYCDENGCLERKREMVDEDLIPPPSTIRDKAINTIDKIGLKNLVINNEGEKLRILIDVLTDFASECLNENNQETKTAEEIAELAVSFSATKQNREIIKNAITDYSNQQNAELKAKEEMHQLTLTRVDALNNTIAELKKEVEELTDALRGSNIKAMERYNDLQELKAENETLEEDKLTLNKIVDNLEAENEKQKELIEKVKNQIAFSSKDPITLLKTILNDIETLLNQ